MYQTQPQTQTTATFHFTAGAPIDAVQPLFGAHREREWAPDWEPRFVHPALPEDREGMVFTVDHPLGVATWINTRLERELVQYAYVIPGVMATLITLRLTPEGARTRVAVTYARTPLAAASREAVAALSRADAAAGPEWQAQLDAALRATSTPAR